MRTLIQLLQPMVVTIAICLVVCGQEVALANSKFSKMSVDPRQVYPTQGVLGLEWAEFKKARFKKLTSAELNLVLQSDPAPAVLGPGQRIYILDSHHEFFVLSKLGVRKAYVYIIEDWSQLTQEIFADRMSSRGWLYLGDSEGEMSFTLGTLPRSVEQLCDDPYRSLANFLKKIGAYEKTKIPHAEFQWANSLRREIPLHLILDKPEEAFRLALEFASSARASTLPGYRGKPSAICERKLYRGST